jgi:hypothetical protein
MKDSTTLAVVTVDQQATGGEQHCYFQVAGYSEVDLESTAIKWQARGLVVGSGALRETRFIENGFAARVRPVRVLYWSAFTWITACLFRSDLQAHIVLPLQASRCLYPLEL